MRNVVEVAVRKYLVGLLMLLSLGAYTSHELSPKSTTLLVKEALSSVVVIECYTPHMGNVTAGFVVSKRGHIVTVAHGLTSCMGKNQKNIFVHFWQEPTKVHKAAILKIDTEQDAAIIQVPTMPTDIKPLDIDISIQEQGGRVFTIGHPGLFYWSVADGVLSSDRIWYPSRRHLMQTSIPIIPGNSGGPVLNDKGLVIGIVSFYVQSPTLNFLIPMDTIIRLARGIYF